MHDPETVNRQRSWRLIYNHTCPSPDSSRSPGQFAEKAHNHLEYFDKYLHTHWYWQDLDQEIAKWHLSLVEALPSSKFWKSEKSWTEWNIVMKVCMHIDIDKMQPYGFSNAICHCRGFAEVQIQTCPSPDSLCSCLSPDSLRKMPTTLKQFGIVW